MTHEEMMNARLQAFREASILASRYTSSYTYNNYSTQPQVLPSVVGLESIIRDAEVIYNYLTKTNGN